MINFKRDSDNLIVAGNGPSLKNMDIDLLPEDFDVFRCNHFYLEDTYYIGNKVKLYGLQEFRFYSLYKTIASVYINQDYVIDEIMLSITEPYAEKLNKYKDSGIETNHMILNIDILKTNKYINRYYNFLQTLNFHTTYGTELIMYGALLGYKNIYTIGIDFYKTQTYMYDTEGKEINKFGAPQFGNSRQNSFHNIESELKLIQFIQKHYNKDINFYNLNNNEILGMKPEKTTSVAKSQFIQKIKLGTLKENYINDIIIDAHDIPKKTSKMKILKQKIKHFINNHKH